MRMGRTCLAAVALVATIFAIAGCGGSSSKPLTRAELTVRANAICKTVTSKLASKSASTEQQLAHVATELASFEQTALIELSRLVPPAELANDWKKFVAGAQTLAENTSKLGVYVKGGSLKSAKGLIVSSETVQQQMRAIAKRDHLAECEEVA
jgi:hypothetical protein